MRTSEYLNLIDQLVNKNSIKYPYLIDLSYISNVKLEWVNYNDSILCLKCCKTFRTRVGYDRHACQQEKNE